MSNTTDNKIDMLHGGLIGKLIMFALPLAITSSLQQLFNAADIIVCGRFVGSIALAAVGANSHILNLAINTFLGLSIGANVMIANYIGAEKKEKIYNVVHTSMTFAFAFGITLMIVGLFLSKNILIFLGTPDEIIDPATLYLRILFIGIPFIVVYNFGAAILRSIGDTKRPLIILTITGILNVILNVIFVVAFRLGVAGVAIATAISNAISSIVVVILLVREKGIVHYDFGKWIFNLDAFYKIMKVGVPSAVQGIVFSVSNLCVQSAINSLGTNTIAANTAAVNLEVFPYFIYTSFSSACLTFMSQNFGALQYDRCKEVVRDCLIIGSVASFALAMIIQLNAHALMEIFTTDEEVIEIAFVRIRWVGITCWIQTLYDTLGAALRVLKHPILPTVMIIIGTVFFRILWCFTVFPIYRTYMVIAIVYPISWILMNITMTVAYVIVSKKMLRVEAN